MTYESEVLADSPWYAGRSNEASGSFLDYSGNARTLTCPGGSPTYAQTGPTGAADAVAWPDSSGGTEYYAISSANIGANTSAMTIECWFYLTATPTNPTALAGVCYGYGNASKRPAELYIDAAGKICLWWGNTSSNALVITSPSAVALNTWHHGVGVMTSTTGKIRLDKVDVVSGSQATLIANTGVFAVHGGNNNNADLTNGSAIKLAKPALYLSTLSDARIDAHYDAMVSSGLTRSDADTITLSDTVAKRLVKSLSDSVTLSDASVRRPVKTFADTVTLTDLAVRAATKALSDLVTLSDARAAGVGRPLADSVTFTDAPFGALTRTLADTITLTDFPTWAIAHLLDDLITFTDAGPTVPAAARTGSADDTITFTDAIAARLGKALADDLATKRLVKILTDQITLADSRAATVTRELADTITLIDGPTTAYGHTLTLADEIVLTDLLHSHGISMREITLSGRLLASLWAGTVLAPRRTGALRAPHWTGHLEET